MNVDRTRASYFYTISTLINTYFYSDCVIFAPKCKIIERISVCVCVDRTMIRFSFIPLRIRKYKNL